MTITPNSHAKDIPIYDKAIARFPHLAYAPDAKMFCLNFSRLVMVPAIKWIMPVFVCGGDNPRPTTINIIKE